MTELLPISERARNFYSRPSRIVSSRFMVSQDPYHPLSNKNGYVDLSTAENRLVWELLEPKLNAARSLVEADSHYGKTYGTDSFRAELAMYFNRYFSSSADLIRPEHLVIANGVTSIIDMLAFATCDAGDTVIVPTPYYPGFDVDFGGKSKVEIIPAHLDAPDFILTSFKLEAAWQEGSRRNKNPKVLLITSPANPMSRPLTVSEIKTAIRFCQEKYIHCVFDEVYAQSCLDFKKFTSALSIKNEFPEFKNNIHFIYGMAKDFALAGFRVGIFHTENTALLTSMQHQTYFYNVSFDTQSVLTNLLRDQKWVDSFMLESRQRIEASFKLFKDLFLNFCEIAPFESGIFAWCDFSAHLKTKDFAGEEAFYQEVLSQAKVNFLPGASFHCSTPGWFRICFVQKSEYLVEAAHRLKTFLEGK